MNNSTALTFGNTTFEVVDRTGQPWIRLPQIGAALGYANQYKVQKVYERHSDEFTDSMTAVVKLNTAGGEQDVRIFSLRGAHLLAMFARTTTAKAFRRWVLDILDQYVGSSRPEKTRKSLPSGLKVEQQDAIKQLIKARVDVLPKEKQAKAAITCWSALKSKFGVSYKQINPDHYTDALSLVARLPLEGELLPPEKAQTIDPDNARKLANYLHDYSLNVNVSLDQLRKLSSYVAVLQSNLAGIEAMGKIVQDDLRSISA